MIYSFRSLFFGWLILIASSYAVAQSNNQAPSSGSGLATGRSSAPVPKAVQLRIDSLRQSMKTVRDQPQSYHDSVLHTLQTRRDSVQRQPGQPTLAQRRIDSLRQALKRTDAQVHAHHDSVLHTLQASRDSVLQMHVVRRADSLRRKAESLHQTVAGQLPPELVSELPTLPSLPATPTLPSLPSAPSLPTTLTEHLGSVNPLTRRGAIQQAQQSVQKYTQPLSNGVQQSTAVAQDAPGTLEAYLAQQATSAGEALPPLAESSTALSHWPGSALNEAGSQIDAEVTGLSKMSTEQAQQRAVEQAKRHFAQHSEAVAEGQQQVNELKQKYKAVQSEQDKYERATSLRGEPWTARLLLGTYFQFYGAAPRREPSFQLDLSPFVGYRFNTRWSVGVGGSYRMVFRNLKSATPLYQARAFAEAVVYRGFALHASYERSLQSVTEAGSNITDEHLLVGIGKGYRITRRIQGTTLMLYRPGDIHESLQLSRWNLRTGFSLDW